MHIKYPFSTSWIDYPDNESLAVVIYFTGCEHNCKDCHNPELQTPIINNIDNVIYKINQELSRQHTNKLVLSGGDCLFDINILLVKNILLGIDKSVEVCIYTGYDIECVKDQNMSGFKYVKCGKFDYKLKQSSIKNDKYITFGSTNQKLYDQNYNLISIDGVYYF